MLRKPVRAYFLLAHPAELANMVTNSIHIVIKPLGKAYMFHCNRVDGYINCKPACNSNAHKAVA